MTANHLADLSEAATVMELFATLFELQVAIYVDIKINHAKLMQLPQWEEWVGQLRAMQAALKPGAQPVRERLIACVNTQHRINDLVRVMFPTK
jgi:hypothetical protein